MAAVRRKWQVFPGRNRFLCNGRLIMAQHPGIFYITVFLIIGTSVLFFIFDCPFLTQRLSPIIPAIGGAFFVFVLSSLFHTSFSDPGIIPRATAEEALYTEKQIEVPNTGNGASYRPPPRTKEVIVRGITVKLKYCFTCKIFRPPRASHCSICDNCIDRFDHHCPWVGNCVGRRNYKYFYLFLVSLAFLCVFILSCVIAHIVLYKNDNKVPLVDAMKANPASLIEGVICFFAVWSVLGLAGFHTYLITSNQTTNEDIKGSFSSRRGQEGRNPYGYGNFFFNCLAILCGPVPPSLIDRRGLVTPEYLISIQNLPLDAHPSAQGRSYGALTNNHPPGGFIRDNHSVSTDVDSGVGSLQNSKIHSAGNIAKVSSTHNGNVITTIKKNSPSSQEIELHSVRIDRKNTVAPSNIPLNNESLKFTSSIANTYSESTPSSPNEDHKSSTRSFDTGVGLTGHTEGISSSQAYLLDTSSYDLDLDSIDESISQPSQSESSQLGLIPPKSV